MIKRYGEAVVSGQRYTMRPGAYAVLARGNDVLVTHQMEPIPEVQLPGGGIDPGESPLVALHLEVYEETGWRIAGPVRMGAYRRFTYMPEYELWAEKICHVYLARPVTRLGPPTEDGHTAFWMPAELAVETLANEGDQAFMRRVFR